MHLLFVICYVANLKSNKFQKEQRCVQFGVGGGGGGGGGGRGKGGCDVGVVVGSIDGPHEACFGTE